MTPPLEKSGTDSKGRFFLEITLFLGRKIDKPGQIQSLKFSLIIQSNVVSIKCRFDQVSFDQLSGHDFRCSLQDLYYRLLMKNYNKKNDCLFINQ